MKPQIQMVSSHLTKAGSNNTEKNSKQNEKRKEERNSLLCKQLCEEGNLESLISCGFFWSLKR